MAFCIDARCDSCDYSEISITVGDGKHVVFFCRRCVRLVNPERVKYRLDCPDCPRCRCGLSRSDFVDAGKLPATWASQPLVKSQVTCPRCDQGKLSFMLKMHMRIARDYRPPKAGQLVHVRVDERGRWRAADIYQQVRFDRIEPDDPAGKDPSLVLECEVVAVDNRSVVLKRIKKLSISELKGYAGYRDLGA